LKSYFHHFDWSPALPYDDADDRSPVGAPRTAAQEIRSALDHRGPMAFSRAAMAERSNRPAASDAGQHRRFRLNIEAAGTSREAMPGLKRVGILANPDNYGTGSTFAVNGLSLGFDGLFFWRPSASRMERSNRHFAGPRSASGRVVDASASHSALHMAIKDIVMLAESPDRLGRSKRCCASLRTAPLLGELVMKRRRRIASTCEPASDDLPHHAIARPASTHLTTICWMPDWDLPGGGETNFVYPVTAGKLGYAERRDFTAPAVVHLPSHSVHSVAIWEARARVPLHVYLGDLTRTNRQLWT